MTFLRPLRWAFWALGFIAFGCSSNQDDPSFSESDMRAAVAGTYSGPIGTTTEVATLTLDQASYVDAGSLSTSSIDPKSSRDLLCGSRNFSKLACLDMTTMQVAGQVTSSGATIPSSSVRGTFIATDLDLKYADLNLTPATGGRISANFSAGQFESWQYCPPAAADCLELALVRQP